MARGLFITGTGTGVGKTYIAALIARQLHRLGERVGVYKPVASGCQTQDGTMHSPDARALWEAAGRPGTLEQVCPQTFAAALAPPLAARAEGRQVDPQRLQDGIRYWRASCDYVLVEGAGGLMSPLADDLYNADLAMAFGYPLLIVAENALGTINATLQTCITAKVCCAGLPVVGVVLNSPQPAMSDESVASNAAELARRCEVPLLSAVPHRGEFSGGPNWAALFGGR